MNDIRSLNVNAVIITRPDPPDMPGRNVYTVFGRPLITWTIGALKHSRLVTGVFVCTADKAAAAAAREIGCESIPLPEELAKERVPRVDVLRHAVTWLYRELQVDTDIAVSVRATIPELRSSDVDAAIELLDRHKLREVITVSSNCLQNDDLRVIHGRALFGTSLSYHTGVVKTGFVDVRSLEDIAALQTRYESRERFEAIRE